jgi:hypothetical protein
MNATAVCRAVRALEATIKERMANHAYPPCKLPTEAEWNDLLEISYEAFPFAVPASEWPVYQSVVA